MTSTKQTTTCQELPLRTTPLTIEELKEHVDMLGKMGNGDKDGFDEEFNYIEKLSEMDFFEDFTSAKLPQNRGKNRYSNVLPLENTRVKLNKVEDVEGSDFVNANFINGDPALSSERKRYIAGQGPLKETVIDFWRMIWDQCSNVIVMLTRITENDRQKCYQYWPDKGIKKIEKKFTVSVVLPPYYDTEELFVQMLKLENLETNELREIMHFQYREWPDHGLPKSTEKFRLLLQMVDEHDKRKGPAIIHCSAGIGRTGTFCTVHSNLAKLREATSDKPARFDVLGTVVRLRKERVGMVQTKEQYMFCYLAILEGALEYEAHQSNEKDNEQRELRQTESKLTATDCKEPGSGSKSSSSKKKVKCKSLPRPTPGPSELCKDKMDDSNNELESKLAKAKKRRGSHNK